MKRTLLQVITTAEHTDTEILAFKLAVSHQPYSYDPTLPQCKWLQNIDYLIYSKLASPASSHCITKLWRRSMNYAVPLFGLNLTLKTNQHKLVDMDGLLNLSKLYTLHTHTHTCTKQLDHSILSFQSPYIEMARTAAGCCHWESN